MSKLFKMPTLGNGLTPDGDGNIIITKAWKVKHISASARA